MIFQLIRKSGIFVNRLSKQMSFFGLIEIMRKFCIFSGESLSISLEKNSKMALFYDLGALG